MGFLVQQYFGQRYKKGITRVTYQSEHVKSLCTNNILFNSCVMIIIFRHEGLSLLYEKDDPSKLQPYHIEKIRRILYRLDESFSIEDMNQIGWGLHELTGNLKVFWSVKVDKKF